MRRTTLMLGGVLCELKNLANDPQHSKTVAELNRLLHSQRALQAMTQ